MKKNGKASDVKPALADKQVTFGDKTFTVRFSVKAMAAMQDHFGLTSITEVGARLSDFNALGIDDLIGVLWAALRTHHPDVTKDMVLDLMDEVGIEGLQSTMQGAYESLGAASAPETEGPAGNGGEDPLTERPGP